MGGGVGGGGSAKRLPVLCSRREPMEESWFYPCFPLPSTQEGLSSKFFFSDFSLALGNDIQGLVHAEQVCHQLSYIPQPW